MSTIDVQYDLTCPAEAVEDLAKKIACEQSVEVPEEVVRAARLGPAAVGEVAEITPLDGDPPRFRATIRYDVALSSFQLSQLLNLIYGNVSIQNHIRVVGVKLPDDLLTHFRGPNLGAAGIRDVLGVHGRPLLATALKPRGAPDAHLAAIARDFALGGGDIVKDDHNLVDASTANFQDRVTRCAAAVNESNAQTGRNTLYFPNLMPPAEQLDQQVEFLLRLGVRGVLVCPFILGLDTVRRLAAQYPLAIMAHPAFAGTFFHDPAHGIAPEILLGQLCRLAGADISVYPNAGGRFAFTPERCQAIAHELQTPLAHLKPALPAPAGGMQFENIPRMAAAYGPEAVFLIGGGLLAHSDSIRASTAAFLERINANFDERLTEPRRTRDESFASACEIPASGETGPLLHHLPFQPNFTWQGRTPTAYKASTELPFSDITRHELLGKSGEQAAFDLRYFEIAPCGYSSLEKHHHTHTLICVRGTGVLLLNDQHAIPLKPYDVAYVPPLAVHQIRNDATEPLGFFCIVDHHRDPPMPP